jgi:hypothetical protein
MPEGNIGPVQPPIPLSRPRPTPSHPRTLYLLLRVYRDLKFELDLRGESGRIHLDRFQTHGMLRNAAKSWK